MNIKDLREGSVLKTKSGSKYIVGPDGEHCYNVNGDGSYVQLSKYRDDLVHTSVKWCDIVEVDGSMDSNVLIKELTIKGYVLAKDPKEAMSIVENLMKTKGFGEIKEFSVHLDALSPLVNPRYKFTATMA